MTMKQIITSILILQSIFQISWSQKVDYDASSKWFLGLNAGVTWNTSDVKTRYNGGYGFTLGRSFNYNYGKAIMFDLRLRYLAGNWDGLDNDSTSLPATYKGVYAQNQDIPSTDYKNTLGYTVYNHRTEVRELGLELALHFNSLTSNTGLDPYLFGGANLSWYRAKGDLLYSDFGNDYMYAYDTYPDFSKNTLKGKLDGKYETVLDGSSSGYNVKFMPSLGVGLGYMVGKRISIGFEHKTTFTLFDQFDGVDANVSKYKNDWYHYTSFYINFRFRHQTETSGSNNLNTNNPNNNQLTAQNCVNPKIVFKDPTIQNALFTSENTLIKATIHEIGNAQNIRITQNGKDLTNFTYDDQTKMLLCNVILVPGTNTFEIIATNACGTDKQTNSLIFQPCTAPKITFTNPTQNGTSVNTANFSLNTTVTNATQVQLIQNGQVINNNLPVTNGKTSSNVRLNAGLNTFEVKATNDCGTDIQSISINYQNCLQPEITLNSRQSNGMTVTNKNFTLLTAVTNIASKQNVSMTLNGVAISNFTYVNGQVSVNSVLKPGINTFVIKATNNCGTATQTFTINLKDCVNPTVAFGQGLVDNMVVNNANFNLTGVVAGQVAEQNISITQNNNFIANFQYQNNQLTCATQLVVGLNTFVVSANNNCGNDTKVIRVVYQPCLKPVVNFSNPSVDASVVSNSSFTFSAIVSNVTNSQNLVVKHNSNTITNYTFNASTGLVQGNVNLAIGTNTFVISANNGCGNDLKTITVNYVRCNAPLISFITPVENNTTVTNANYSFQVKVTSGSQNPIVTFNNQNTTNYTWNPATGILVFNAILVPGVNVLNVTANNNCGTANNAIQINYNNCIAPSITLNATNNAITSNANYTLNASVAGIQNAQNLVLSQNNNPITNFSFNGGVLGSNVTLNSGLNTFVISANNACGNDVKTLNVTYNPCTNPTITVINALPANALTNDPNFTINAQFQNVLTNQIQISLNGSNLTGLTLGANGNLSKSITLIPGINNIQLQANNNCGFDSKVITLNYRPCESPSIQKINPNNNSITAENSAFSFIANLQNVQNTNQISLYFNNQVVTNYNFNAQTGQLVANFTLVEGINKIDLSLTNNCGNANEKYEVNYIPKVVVASPLITFNSPANCPYTVTEGNMTISGFIANITSKSEAIITFGGNVITDYAATFTSEGMSFSFTVSVNANTSPYSLVVTAGNSGGRRSNNCQIIVNPLPTQKMTICHYPPGNTDNPQTIEIPVSAWPAHQAHGDVEGPCPAPQQKITICHYDNPTRKYITMEINESEWPTYQALGDQLGACQTTTTNPVVEKKIMICHYPPGNTGNPQAIEIPESAWPAHQAHGDSIGACPSSQEGQSNQTEDTKGDGIRTIDIPKTPPAPSNPTRPNRTTRP